MSMEMLVKREKLADSEQESIIQTTCAYSVNESLSSEFPLAILVDNCRNIFSKFIPYSTKRN